jgi:glyoxylase-like metal-dependent hydrolase (beta-lactamase superfamily II)
VEVEQIRAICLTHLDRDHFNLNWLATLVKHAIRVFCHEQRVDELRESMRTMAAGREAMTGAERLVSGFDGVFEPIVGVRMHSIHLPHDAAGSHGFLVESGRYRLGYATDLGKVPERLVELFCGVHVLAIESNYDLEMEKNSDRPWVLKQRVMGGAGHLSNEQALRAVRAILDRTQKKHGEAGLPRHIVLLHRSRECNCPKLLRRLFEGDQRIKRTLTLAEQGTRTEWLKIRQEVAPAGAGEQMGLFF